MWLAFGHGNSFRYISAHGIAQQLDEQLSKGILFLHAFSGCDTVSSFCGIGKKTAWNVLQSMKQVLPVFQHLSSAPSSVTEEQMNEIERYVVVMYKNTSQLSKVNEARKQLFSSGNRKIEKIPPTKAALQQHVRRAAYQAGHIWGQALIPNPTLPSPSDWGWVKQEEKWCPLWTNLSQAAIVCKELVKCGCTKRCSENCKCRKSILNCTHRCGCQGECFQ